MIYVISYASGQPFEKFQKYNDKTAKLFGKADRVISYTGGDIPYDYKIKHANIFKYKRGAGLWLWKAYLVNKTLEIINDGDWLFYKDASCFFVSSLKPLIKEAELGGHSLMLFGLPLLNRQFCKRECYVSLGLEDNNENQALATYFLLQKNLNTVRLMKEWLSWCEREDLICPERVHMDIPEFPDFFSHREDQSLLSLLAIKYKLPLYMECSNFRIFPQDYCYKEFEYKPLQTNKGDYGVILISHRAIHPLKYYAYYIKKRILSTLHIKYTENQVLKNPPSFSSNL